MSTTNPRGMDINLRSVPQMCEYRDIADRVAEQHFEPVLDWGGGWGQVTHLLRERGVDVEAFDYLEGAKPRLVQLQRFPEITAHVSGDPVKLPFSDGRFGAVLSCGVLEHVQDPAASLKELRRVLRPGGRLFIYKLPNRFSYLERIAKTLGLYYHGKLENDRVYDLRRIRALVPAHGFRIDAVRRTNMLPLTLDHAFASRHADGMWRANRRLGRTPLLNLLATNLEVDASAIPAPESQ